MSKSGIAASNRRRTIDPRTRYVVSDCGHGTPCWIWQGAKNAQGYGYIRRNGQDIRVHRWFYEQEHDVELIPVDKLDHLCRQPSCVRPDHLELVTVAINTRRGRSAKLTSDDVYIIRNRRELGESPASIAKHYKVHVRTIQRAISGETWA